MNYQFYSYPFSAFATALILSLGVTYVVRSLATSFGFVAKPKLDRWHKRPTALMGGVAIFLTTIVVALFFVPLTLQMLIVLVGSFFMFLVGLIDDILNIKPYQKLVGQLISATVVVGGGLRLPWTEYELINILITLFWLIGITNAINLLDNMDGLAAGIAAVAALTLGAILGLSNQSEALTLILIFVGALIGFLRFNFNPASIFMGDSGSLFIGFFLASLVLLSQSGGQSRSVFLVLAVPVLTLFVPIFDTTFVTILRKLWGRKASQGGRDHTSHRLVALGLSERAAVLMLYGFAALAGLLALTVYQLRLDQSIALISLFVVSFTLVGVYLGKVKVYEEQHSDRVLSQKAFSGFLIDVSYKRRVFEVILDVFLITFAYYAAYALLFDSLSKKANYELFIKTLPILVILKLTAFLGTGVYRGLWRYTSVNDLVTFGKATIVGSIASILAILLIYRFQGFSRAVFALDALLLFVMLSSSRLAFRFFRQILPSSTVATSGERKRKVLIFGAGDGGEMVLREISNNVEWNYRPIGFVDDDPMKKGKVIHGLRVFGGNGSIAAICQEHQIEEILLSPRKIKSERLRELQRECENIAVEIKRAMFRVEKLDEFDEFFK